MNYKTKTKRALPKVDIVVSAEQEVKGTLQGSTEYVVGSYDTVSSMI